MSVHCQKCPEVVTQERLYDYLEELGVVYHDQEYGWLLRKDGIEEIKSSKTVAALARQISPIEYTIIDAIIAEGAKGIEVRNSLRQKLEALRAAAHPPQKETKKK